MFKVVDHDREFINPERSYGTLHLVSCGIDISIAYDVYNDQVELDSNVYIGNKVVKLHRLSDTFQTVLGDYVTEEIY